MTGSSHRLGLFCSFLLAACATVQAEAVLDHLPADALGFVHVRNLAATSGKIEKVAKLFEDLSPQPIPAPLAVLEAATGLGPGLNDQGDALLALLPGSESEGGQPLPLLLVAASDYAAFAESVGGDASGEVCRVTIAGQEVLAAKRNAYVALMNVEHRSRLEALLAAAPQTPDGVAPLSEWLARVDVAVALTPAGVDLLTAMGQAGLAQQRATMEEQLADPQVAEMLEQAQQGLAMYERILGFLGAKVEAAAAGLAIDDAANLRLLTQVVLSQEGGSASDSPAAKADPSIFVGSPATPYVFVGGGPVPPAYGEALARMSRNMVETFPGAYGFEKLTEQQWQDLESSMRDSMKGLRSMSMVMLTGEEDDPLYSNVYGKLSVENAAEYLDSYRRAMQTWNDLMVESTTGIKMQYEFSDVEIAGKKGVLMSADMVAAAGDENVPMVQMMMRAMFGEDGVMRVYLVPADDTTVVMGIADEEGVAEALRHVAAKERGLADSAALQTTVKLLDPEAPWQAAFSPQGGVAWVKRLINNFMAPLGGGAPNIPEYPDSPPIGLSIKLEPARFSSEMVWPVETLKSLAAYIKTVSEAF